MSRSEGVDLWEMRLAASTAHTLVVVSDDETLGRRAAALLERDGFELHLEADVRNVRAIDALERRPTLLLIRGAGDRRKLEHTVRDVHGRFDDAILVVVVPAGSPPDVGLVLSSGADALILEQELEAALAPVVRAAAAQQISVPAGLRHGIQPPALSHRERQVLGLALAGLSNGEIATRLYLAESTVKSHLAAAFRHLGVHSRREAAAVVFTSDDALRRTVAATLRLADEFSRRTQRR